MVYTNTQGVVIKDKNKLAMFLVAIGFAIFATIGFILPTKAITTPEGSVAYTSVPLSQQELDDKWFVDRAIPSGGFESLTFDGRDDVLEVRIDKDNRSAGSNFYYTEGLQRVVDDKDALKIDLYIDSDWLDNEKDVRAGLWGVGNDDSDVVTAYPIIEFTNSDSFTGWRVWDGVNGGWTELGAVGFTPDEWSTLEIFYNEADSMFDYYTNGSKVHSDVIGGTTNFGAVILNSYNYGTDGQSYDVHWSNFELGVFEPNPPVLLHEVSGGGHILDVEGKRKNWNDISFGMDFKNYDVGAEGNVTVRFHNVGFDELDKSTFHGSTFTEFVYAEGTGDCDAAMRLRVEGTLNGEEGYQLTMRGGDNEDTVRFELEGPGVNYDSNDDWGNESNCQGNARADLDKGNLKIKQF